MGNKFILFVFVFLILLNVNFISAHGEDTFAEAEEIIQQKISCDELTEEQLEILGDYYMEQMHPGEQHEVMDKMMGGEGSESLKQVHINMALSFYCGEHDAMSAGIMNNLMGKNMRGDYDYSTNNPFMWLFNALLIVGLILLIIWIINKSKNKKN